MSGFRRMLFLKYATASKTVDLSGYCTVGTTSLTFNVNGNAQTVSVNSTTGYWEWSKPSSMTITSLAQAFNGATTLTKIDVSNLDVSNVTSLYAMFYGCTNLEEITGLNNWDTSNVTTIRSMFHKCSTLTEIYCPDWDMSSITMDGSVYGSERMCYSCTNLLLADFRNWQLPSDGSFALYNMFKAIHNVEVRCDNWELSSSPSYSYFVSDYNTVSVYYKRTKWTASAIISSFTNVNWVDLIPARKITGYTSANLTVSLKINGTANTVTADSTGYFEYSIPDATVITSLYKFLSANGDDGGYSNNNQVTSIDLTNILDTSSNTSLAYMFENCENLESITFGSTFNTSSVTTIRNMCSGCYDLTSIDMSMFDLTSIPESSSDPENGEVSNVFYMSQSNNLTEVHLPYIPCRVSSNFLYGCTHLTELYTNGIKYEFKVTEPTLSANSVSRIVSALYDWSDASSIPSNITLHVSDATRALFTTEQENTLSAKSWNINPAVKSNIYIEDFTTDDNLYDNGYDWYLFSASSGQANIALNEPSSDQSAGAFYVDIPTTFDATNGLYVYVDLTTANNNEVVNGITTTNNYFKFYIKVEDASGNITSDWLMSDDQENCTPGTTETKSFSNVSLTGLDSSHIRKIYFSLGDTWTEKKKRLKGIHFDTMTVRDTAPSVSLTLSD